MMERKQAENFEPRGFDVEGAVSDLRQTQRTRRDILVQNGHFPL
jgi:hypothetical protein